MSHFEALTPAHVPVMTALHALSFERPWSEVVFFDLLKLPTHMGFIGKDGFILCSVVMDEAEILTFCVAPKARHRGVGKALLAVVEEALKEKKVHSFYLEVGDWNVGALALYRKAGFVETGHRKGYYLHEGARHDAILMKKEL